MSDEGLSGVRCPLCGGGRLHDFYSREGVPATCASAFPDAAQARQVPRGDIDLAACERCGLAFNRSFDPGLGELGARYESSQAASPRFNTYAAELARAWVARHRLEGKAVLEIGCGDGDFLRQLIDAGAGRAIGVDPMINITRAMSGMPAGVELIARRFDASQLEIEADALVCRHTLEHVPDVREFLTLVQQWAARAPRRVVLFDLPDAERVFEERAFWDIYYEHCNYFTTKTLRRAFEFCGLRVLALQRQFQGQYLSIEAVADRTHGFKEPPDTGEERQMYRSFAARTRSSLQRCESALRRLKTPSDPLIVWQGGAKTVGFLSALKHPELIDGAVDVSPHRQGIFLPASGLPVYAPRVLRELEPRHVILMNPAYQAEVSKTLSDLGLAAQLHPVVDLLQ